MEKYEEFRLNNTNADILKELYRKLEIDKLTGRYVHKMKKAELVKGIMDYYRKHEVDIITLISKNTMAAQKNSQKNDTKSATLLPYFIPKRIDVFSDLWSMNVGEILYVEDPIDLHRYPVREIETWTIDDPSIVSYVITKEIRYNKRLLINSDCREPLGDCREPLLYGLCDETPYIMCKIKTLPTFTSEEQIESMAVFYHTFTAKAPGSTMAMCGYTNRIISINVR
jgi:hypothetical protein